MSKDKLSAQNIVDELAAKASVNKKTAEDFLKVFISTLEDTLMGEEPVKVKNFGTFKILWIEPRKSVNVKTGEEIILNGYYKIDFTPDNVLKERVNEPFAHLEPVVLDEAVTQPEKTVADASPQMDPLKTLNEQADEIKNLLSEIKSLTPVDKSDNKTGKTELITEPVDIDNSHTVVASGLVSETPVRPTAAEQKDIQQHVLDTPAVKDMSENPMEHSKEEELIEEIEAEIEPVAIPHVQTSQNELEHHDADFEYKPNRFLEGVAPLKTPRGWLWLAMLLVVVIVVGVLSYFNIPEVNEWANTNIFKTNVELSPKPVVAKELKHSPVIAHIQKKDSIQPKDLVKKAVQKDSILDIFSKPRSYTEFVAAERLFAGNRLAHIAKKYFGHSDFWVYLYEANKQRITDPNKIKENTLIQIPKLDKRLIDPKNPLCIQKARELGSKYLKK